MRFLIFVFLLAIIIYFSVSWTVKWIDSIRRKAKREEYEKWKQFDTRLNPSCNYTGDEFITPSAMKKTVKRGPGQPPKKRGPGRPRKNER